MKYLGYIIVLAAGVAGFLGVRVWMVLLLALIATFSFATARRNVVKNTPQAPDQNMFLDGIFLLFQQVLILFAAYLLGAFIASPGGDLFVDFLSGKQPGPDVSEP